MKNRIWAKIEVNYEHKQIHFNLLRHNQSVYTAGHFTKLQVFTVWYLNNKDVNKDLAEIR